MKVTSFRPCFASMKVPMWSIGPGLKRAIIAAISLIVLGFNSFICLVIPELSSWKTPTVSPRPKSWNVALSSKGTWPKVSFTLWLLSIKSNESAKTVKLTNPKKSIFNNPKSAIGDIAYWVITAPLSSFREVNSRGTTSSKGSLDITTPAACKLLCLVTPSSSFAVSINFLITSSESYTSFNESLSSKDVFRSILSFSGIIFATLSTFSKEIPKALPASLTDWRAPKVPNVIIWATCSLPYLWAQ